LIAFPDGQNSFPIAPNVITCDAILIAALRNAAPELIAAARTLDLHAAEWDQNRVLCDNCGVEVVARGGSIPNNKGLSEPHGEDEILCGHCAGLEMYECLESHAATREALKKLELAHAALAEALSLSLDHFRVTAECLRCESCRSAAATAIEVVQVLRGVPNA